MAKPYSIYFQKSKLGSPAIDTKSQWGIVCKDFPFTVYGDIKDLPKRDWIDQDGEDTFFPEELYVQAYDIKVEFAYKGDMGTANEKIVAFLDYLIGKDGYGTELKVYDTYTQIGRQGVYFKSIKPDLFVRKTDEGDVVTFNITFRVTDPKTQIILTV